MDKFVAITLALAIAAPSHAEVGSIVVQYEDLDLATPQGIARLNGRIEAALDKVCGKPEVRDVKVAASQKACREDAGRKAFGEVARAVEAKTGVALATMLARGHRG